MSVYFGDRSVWRKVHAATMREKLHNNNDNNNNDNKIIIIIMGVFLERHSM